jgi:hypothetical protein
MHSWSIFVMRTTPQNRVFSYWFDLKLPDRPKGSVPWSDWIEPLDKVADEITIRYRWVLTPEGQERVYQP